MTRWPTCRPKQWRYGWMTCPVSCWAGGKLSSLIGGRHVVGVTTNPTATLDMADRLRKALDRDNLYIKIPATAEALSAITQAGAGRRGRAGPRVHPVSRLVLRLPR